MKWFGRPSQPRWFLKNGEYTCEDGVTATEERRQCAKCGQQEAGAGNVLCVQCKQQIEAACESSE